MIDDLCDQKIGKLLVIEKIQKTKKNGCSYLCRCECGVEKIINKSKLVTKNVASCGCSYFNNIIGLTFNSWTVLERIPNDPTLGKNEIKWKCRCKCGKISVVLGKCLKNGTSKSCGCLIDELGPNLTGRIFGYLTVVNKVKQKVLPYLGAKWKRRAWNCVCNCGVNKIVTENQLLSNKYTSCGCMRISRNIDQNRLANKKSRKYTPREASAKNVYWRNYDDGDISFEDFLVLSQKDCFYCGEKPSNRANRFKNDKTSSLEAKELGEFIYNGLDRIDSTGKHTLNNIVTSCKICNYAKRRMTLNEFYNWIEKVHNKLKTNKGING